MHGPAAGTRSPRALQDSPEETSPPEAIRRVRSGERRDSRLVMVEGTYLGSNTLRFLLPSGARLRKGSMSGVKLEFAMHRQICDDPGSARLRGRR